MKKLIAMAGVVLACVAASIVPAAAETVDFSPVLTPIIQAVGMVASVTALPVMWMGVNWIRNKLHLQALAKDDALRVAIDAGLQKSVGSAISKSEAAVAGLPMAVNVKNQVIADAATYAKNTIGDTLKAANLDDPTKLASAIEARLGVMEMQTSTGQSSPAIPTNSQPLAPKVS